MSEPVGPSLPGWTPREPLRPQRLAGRTVTLRPLRVDDAPSLWSALGGPAAPPSLFTYLKNDPPNDEDELRAVLQDALRAPASWALAICRDDLVVGMASYLRTDTAAGSVEVGNILFAPPLQRTTAATEAMHLMAEHAFAAGYRRYEWKCDSLNAPSRAAATRLGFTLEGTFRNALVYKGRSRDTTWFSITDDEWPAVRDAHRRWLDEAVAGSPRTSLTELTAALRP
ncbi:GNAT family N-acetyltransferase [Janibacter sp. Y6]|uniref:GNAT family N-acetyltransferase n=1 Tax=Janibacter sp. Y6 TaxID=2913552 RepID=UPI0034A2A186